MRKHDGYWVVIIFCLIVAALGIYNYITNPDFFSCSAVNCLTLLIAVVVSFFLVQKRADKKNQKDSFVKLLNKIQDIVDDKEAYEIHENTDPNMLTMRKRQLSNYAEILKKNAVKYDLVSEAEFINEKVEEYSTFLGNHISDLKYLSQSAKDLRRPLELIDSKIYEMIFKLYE